MLGVSLLIFLYKTSQAVIDLIHLGQSIQQASMGNIFSTSYDNVAPSSVIEWQGLPEELVMLILDKLLETIDYVRFVAVCKEWYCLA